MRSLLDFQDCPYNVPLLAPELKEAAPVRFRDGIPGEPHVEENAAVLKQGGGWMSGKVIFESLCELGG